MKFNSKLIKQNKKAIWFLLVFVGLYLVLNTVYGLFIQHYYPTSDPFTLWVADQVIWILSFFDPAVQGFTSAHNEYIAVANKVDNIIYVYEGCNGINVMIVYLSFLIAFRGPLRLFLLFSGIGIIGIHLMNLFRILLLYGVSIYFPDYVYYFHKYLFTGGIYLGVFILWFFWVRKLKHAY